MGQPDQVSAAAAEARRATGGAAGRGRGERCSARRKRETVLRLLRGEDLESVSRGLGVTALGADRRDVRRMVLRQGVILAGIGVVIGLVAAVGLTRFMSSLLYGVEATDPVTFAAVAALLTAVALVASYLPAVRASRTDPLVALRCE